MYYRKMTLATKKYMAKFTLAMYFYNATWLDTVVRQGSCGRPNFKIVVALSDLQF